MASPKFSSLLSGGRLSPGLNVTYDPRVMNQYRAQATSAGPTPWAAMSSNELSRNIQEQQQRTVLDNLRNARMIQESAAQTGGVDTLTKDRLGRQSDIASMLGKQRLRGQERLGLQSLSLADQEMKDKMLSNLPAMEYQAGAADRFNIANALRQKDLQDQFNLQKYSAKMQKYGAKKTGQAISQYGGGNTGIFDSLNKTLFGNNFGDVGKATAGFNDAWTDITTGAGFWGDGVTIKGL